MMDKIFAVLCLIVVVALIVALEIYMKMDRNRTLAIVMLKNMQEGLERWVSVTGGLFEQFRQCPQYGEYKSLSDKFHAVSRKRIYEKVALVNSLQHLTKVFISDNCENSDVIAAGHDLTDIFLGFAGLQSEYNRLVIKLNDALSSKMSGAIGKLFRLNPMEKLNDLSML